MTWRPHIEYASSKTPGALINLISFFTYLRITSDNRLRIYKFHIWGCTSHAWLKRIKQNFSRTLWCAMGILWFVKNEHILKETSLATMTELATCLTQKTSTSQTVNRLTQTRKEFRFDDCIGLLASFCTLPKRRFVSYHRVVPDFNKTTCQFRCGCWACLFKNMFIQGLAIAQWRV